MAGDLHGANTLGGNSLAEILVFGKKVGKYKSIYSKKLSLHSRSLSEIQNANNRINSQIKEGVEIGRQLENEI